MAPILSQNKVGGCGMQTRRLCSEFLTHITFVVAFASVLYSTLVKDIETIF